MRLIDADTIDFEEVFGGQSDFAKYIRAAAQELIDRQPTVFDKEKVVEKLVKRRSWYDINENPQNPLDVSECADVREHKGKWIAYDDAIAIVEKGGLN